MSSVGCLVIDHMKEYLCEIIGMEPTIHGDVHIHTLEVWKCAALEASDDVDLEELKETLLRLDLSNKQIARMPRPTLKVLSLGLKEDERLLVQLPSPLWCLFVDHDQKPVRFVSVTISPGTNVLNVKEMVLEKARIEIGLTDPAVWRCFGLKVRGMGEDDQAFEARVRTFDLSDKRHAERLCETSAVLKLKVPPDEMLLVQFPNIRQDKRKHDENDDPPSQLKRLRMEIAEAPSLLAVSSEFQKITGPEHGIAFNRPFEPFTIPLVLLHEAFAIFKDRCEKAPSERALICLSKLVPVACEWHGLELSRRTAIQSVIAQHTGLQFREQKVPGTEFTTDGNLAIIVMPAAIRECKKEHGNVLNQAILYYANFLSKTHEDHRRFYNFNTRFPSILMVDMGPYLGFYGAVWDGKRVRVEPLTPLFDLSTHWRETKARCAIAASFDALMIAVNSIEAHYNSIEAEANVNSPPERYDRDLQKARGYPFLTSYEDNGQEINFMYNERLHDEKLIFSAAIVNQPDSEEFVVKFTPWYSEDAHNCLSSHNLAPRLRRCVRISADWIAVIMDKSKYRVLFGLQLSDADKEKVRHKVTSMVRMLHQEGFVHGDIREANILIDYKSLTSDDVKIHLIDFDWAGPIGEAKYPAEVNKITMRRPDGVEGGGLITKQHDIEMISFLFA
ncbi:hypothetical protein F5887DRAFT_979972 [Amanita rubescens]|nr:hypothetical protein F5887DRAFT_979972 [Amanita rubescens]